LIFAGNIFTKQKIMADKLTGAWMNEGRNKEQLLLFTDSYYTYTVYSKTGREFIETRGGPYAIDGDQLNISMEFDTVDNAQTGGSLAFNFLIAGDELTITVEGKKTRYKKIDDGSAPLAGVWHITSQMREGKIVPIHRTGTRKTLKILSGIRFQWVAIDPGTKEFFGTGGGVYQFSNGKYTEKIEFFSRDGNRVGASLSFDGKLENGDWHHSGLSSKGETIYEIWSSVDC
jgi:hypothetical protein